MLKGSDAKGQEHDIVNGHPGQAAGCMTDAVQVLVPPAAIDVLVTDGASGPATISGTGLVGVHGDVLHSIVLLDDVVLQ